MHNTIINLRMHTCEEKEVCEIVSCKEKALLERRYAIYLDLLEKRLEENE